MNGGGSAKLEPSIVTCRSCITSSSADWVLAGARLISSASSRLVNTGPRRTTKPSVFGRSEEHTSELQSLMRISYAVFCLKKKKKNIKQAKTTHMINTQQLDTSTQNTTIYIYTKYKPS